MEQLDGEQTNIDRIWETYLKEWETANNEKRIELNKRMRRWQDLIDTGMAASKAYNLAIADEEGESLIFTAIEEKPPKSPVYTAIKEESYKSPSDSFWPNLRQWPIIFIILAFVAACIYGSNITIDRNELSTELESVQGVLSSTQSELIFTKQILTSTKAELDSARQTLASAQSELTSTKQALTSKQSELTLTNQTLVSAQTELNSTKQTLDSRQAELEKAQAKIILFQDTFGADVFAGQQPQVTGGGSVGSPTLKNNPNATNPTWGDLEAFLLSDPTDDGIYSLYTYNCVSFAEMLHNNAEAAGIKSALVSLSFKDEPIGHALNAFKTSNIGLVYVDCTGGTVSDKIFGTSTERDRIAYVQKNRRYGVLSIHTFISPEYSYFEENFELSKDFFGYWWVPGEIVESIDIWW
ncbi:hypothetical protein ACFLUG_04265 [Chloroflexota bacterium]